MKRIFHKSRGKADERDKDRAPAARHAIPSALTCLSRDELEDLFSRVITGDTITSHAAISPRLSRPNSGPLLSANSGALGALRSAFAGRSSLLSSSPPLGLNHSGEVCPVCLDFDPTVDPAQIDFETAGHVQVVRPSRLGYQLSAAQRGPQSGLSTVAGAGDATLRSAAAGAPATTSPRWARSYVSSGCSCLAPSTCPRGAAKRMVYMSAKSAPLRRP